MQRAEVVELTVLISTYWPHWHLPTDDAELDALIAAWLRLLGDVDQRAAAAAVDAYATEGAEFAPGPGVIRQRALHLANANAAPDVDEAWAEVRREIRRVGNLRGTERWVGTEKEIIEVDFSHPAILTAVDAMGWDYLCNSNTDDEMADRAHFMKMYAAARARSEREVAMPASVRELVAGAGISLTRMRELDQ